MTTAVTCVGDITVDLTVNVDMPPRPGEETFVEEATVGVGGSAANTASILARLGVEAAIVAAVGSDPFGERALQRLGERGVDTAAVAVLANHITGLIVIMVDGRGERTMIGLRGANPHLPSLAPTPTGWLHVSGYALLGGSQREAARRAMRSARRRGTPFSVDIPSGVAARLGPRLLDDLHRATLVTVGREALACLAADAQTLRNSGVESVAVTAGAGPVSYVTDARTIEVSPPAVEPVDSTGAGDAFVAGLIAARIASGNPEVMVAAGSLLGVTAVLSSSVDDPGWASTLDEVASMDWGSFGKAVAAAAALFRRPLAPGADG